MIHALKEHLQQAQNRMKKIIDAHQTDKEFQEGDWVFCVYNPTKRHQIALRRN